MNAPKLDGSLLYTPSLDVYFKESNDSHLTFSPATVSVLFGATINLTQSKPQEGLIIVQSCLGKHGTFIDAGGCHAASNASLQMELDTEDMLLLPVLL